MKNSKVLQEALEVSDAIENFNTNDKNEYNKIGSLINKKNYDGFLKLTYKKKKNILSKNDSINNWSFGLPYGGNNERKINDLISLFNNKQYERLIFEIENNFKDKEINFFYPYFLTLLSGPMTLFEVFPFIFLSNKKFLFNYFKLFF